MSASPMQTVDGQLLDEDDLAQLLKLSPITLQQWRVKGGGPPFVRLGRAVRYRRNDVDTWVASGLRANTSQVLG